MRVDGRRCVGDPQRELLKARANGFRVVKRSSKQPTNDPSTGRWPLVVAHSPDGGRTWSEPKLLANPNPEDGYRADYPTICQTEDGTIVIVWQEQTLPRHLGKELRVARFNRAWLLSE